MKPLTEVEAILIDSGLKASGLDYKALGSVGAMLAPPKSRGRGKDPEAVPVQSLMAFAGFAIAVASRTADSLGAADASEVDNLKAGAKGARELFDSIPALDASEWIYFELGQWGATGDRTYLSRIMDRARHRDGSSAAISASSAALGILQLAAFTNPAYLGIFSEMGFDPEAVRYGNNPSGRESFEALRGDRDIQPETVVLDPDAEQAAAAGAVSSTLAASASGAYVAPAVRESARHSSPWLRSILADSSTGSVNTGLGPVSITDALGAIVALTVETRRLLLPLPYEGYQWDDFAGSDVAPSSILFTNDSFEGERLKLFQPSPLNPLFIAGRVTQDGIEYVPSLYDPVSGMFMPLGGRVNDLNFAKFTVASRLKAVLAGSGATPSGSAPPPTPEQAAATQVASQSITGAGAPVLDVPAGSSSAGAESSPGDAAKSAAKPAAKRKAAAKKKPATKKKG
jgi:hypothetical protein